MISIIVPIYNVAGYLPQCIESICSQTYKELEIILVDDGSSDGSSQICDRYAEKDNRIRVIHKVNGGLVSARKAGLIIARGDFVGYVDGDDWIEPDMYMHLYKRIEEFNADIVICDRYEDTGSFSKKIQHAAPEGFYTKKDLTENVYSQMIINSDYSKWGIFPQIWDKLYKIDILKLSQFNVDERITMGEDAACVYPCLLEAKSIYILHECLYHYRQNLGSMIKQVTDKAHEQNSLRTLYYSVGEQMVGYPTQYNLLRQWQRYLLYLMIPRADHLYEGFEDLDYLFPFSQVKKNTKIVLYGAGTYGQRLNNYLRRTQFAKIVCWADRNYVELSKQGLSVCAPNEIGGYDFDYIVVAIVEKRARTDVFMELSKKYTEKKVAVVDEELYNSFETRKALGLDDISCEEMM